MRSSTATTRTDPVLVAIDFSEDSERALAWAADYAGTIEAPLEILHVIHDPAESPGRYRSENGDALEPIADVAARRFRGFLEEVHGRNPDIPTPDKTVGHCIEGLPVPTILQVAEQRNARLLVLGCRGRNGAARLLFGSTSQKVAQKSRIPVTIVKAEPK